MSKKTIGIFLKTGLKLLGLKNKLLTFVLKMKIIKKRFTKFVIFKKKKKKEIIEKMSNEIIRIFKCDNDLPKDLQLNINFNLHFYTKIQNRLVDYLFNITFLDFISESFKFSKYKKFDQKILREAFINKFPIIHNFFLESIKQNDKFDLFLTELKKIELKKIEELPKKKVIFKVDLSKKKNFLDEVTFNILDKDLFLKKIKKILENFFHSYAFKKEKDFLLKLLFIIIDQKNKN